ncbi:MAG: cation transporter [Solirubrobacterales bacterium]
MSVSAAMPLPSGTPEWTRAAGRARLLSWISLVWMGAEGTIAITAGLLASSAALIGFGLDSAIEGFASLAIVWRFSGSRMHSLSAERRAQKFVAAQFFLLAPLVTFEAFRDLITSSPPSVSWLGIALTATSLVGMPILGVLKQRLGHQLGSTATYGEGTQNLLCAYLAAAVMVGLLGNALVGAWWLDPIAALFVAAIALVEGRRTLRGDACCVDVPSQLEDDCCEPAITTN